MDNYLCSQSSEIIRLTQSKYDIRLLWEKSRYNKNSIIYIIFTHVLVKIKGGHTCVPYVACQNFLTLLLLLKIKFP